MQDFFTRYSGNTFIQGVGVQTKDKELRCIFKHIKVDLASKSSSPYLLWSMAGMPYPLPQTF